MDFYLEKIKETKEASSPFHASHGSATYFLGDFFGGGISTIYVTLQWLLNYMARNPEVQKNLQEEIEQVIGNSRLPSLSNRGQMPYADAMVHEVRMSTPLPLGIPHKTTADLCFHDYNIKKDTMVFGNVYGMHHDPEIWGDPENFRPERWLGESGRKLKSDHFFAFSTGRRNCLGEALARDQLFLYITTLFQSYSVDFDLGSKGSEVKGIFGIAYTPSKFSIIFSQRKIQ